MSQTDFAILGVGNILEKDDGIAIYATAYLEQNYSFEPPVYIKNGGVDGINLLNFFTEHKHILILDAMELDDEAGAIYHIPSHELTGYGVNSGGAHEIGVIECLDILELMGKELPTSSILGIVPHRVEVEIGLTEILEARFETYIETALSILQKNGINATPQTQQNSLKNIIEAFRNPHGN